jgi:hypothetical protein
MELAVAHQLVEQAVLAVVMVVMLVNLTHH